MRSVLVVQIEALYEYLAAGASIKRERRWPGLAFLLRFVLLVIGSEKLVKSRMMVGGPIPWVPASCGIVHLHCLGQGSS